MGIHQCRWDARVVQAQQVADLVHDDVDLTVTAQASELVRVDRDAHGHALWRVGPLGHAVGDGDCRSGQTVEDHRDTGAAVDGDGEWRSGAHPLGCSTHCGGEALRGVVRELQGQIATGRANLLASFANDGRVT